MKIQTLETAGIPSALHAMRNPMDSWSKTDSAFTSCAYIDSLNKKFIVGETDKDLHASSESRSGTLQAPADGHGMGEHYGSALLVEAI